MEQFVTGNEGNDSVINHAMGSNLHRKTEATSNFRVLSFKTDKRKLTFNEGLYFSGEAFYITTSISWYEKVI